MAPDSSIWGREFSGRPFVFMEAAHLIALAIVLALSVSFWWKPLWRPSRSRAAFRYGVAAVLLGNEALWYVWHYLTRQGDLQTLLPFHLCSVLVYVGAAALITLDQTLFEFLYYLGIMGALQALLTPNIGAFGFPHIRFLSTFISHGLIFAAPIYLAVVEGLRPTWTGLWRVFARTNVYMAFVGVVNWLVGGNYLYIAHKPETATALDCLGPWPYYIAGMEAVGLLLMLALYAPFARRHQQAAVEGAEA